MKRRPQPRKWSPRNPLKYVGNPDNIVSRSSWETKFLNWCDLSPSVLQYASEELVIPYVSPIDGKTHRYFVDFIIAVKDRTGRIKKYAVEIKPSAECNPPIKRKNQKVYLEESMTYITNQAKWAAARKFCENINMEFIVLTEQHLFVTEKK